MNIENTISYVFVILIIILVIPLLPYIISVSTTVKNTGGGDDEDSNIHLIDAYGTVSEDLIIYNTLNELYLLCSYIPFRRVKICTADTSNEDLIHVHYYREILMLRKLQSQN